ncbi:MAG: helix-turn-helix transcriptional regulator [Clostridia bacterium]|nr:helix-turn-helix transcriptional regulator [Clostridia bacterium]
MHIGLNAGSISYAHNISHKPTESFLIHNHPTYELYYYISGNASFLVNGVEYSLEPHTMLVFPPNVFHGIRVSDSETYDRYTLHFTVDSLGLDWRAMLTRALPRAEKAGDIPCLRKNMEGKAMHALFRQMDECASHDPVTCETLLPLLTESLISTILLSSSPNEQSGSDGTHVTPTQENIINYLNEHFTEPITLDALAERFFLSKNHLNRSFRKVTGTTVRDYLISKRVTYVQQLLINGIPATQAASLAGFGDYTSFYRAYVKRFGHSPSQDRSPYHAGMVNLDEVLQEQIVFTPDAYRIKLEENS